MKNLIIIIACVAFFGCANGTWNTGSKITDAALAAATSALSTEALSAAAAVASGSDIKTALVQSSGDALRSLEATGIVSLQPVIAEQVAKWVPKNSKWQTYANTIGGLLGKYVQTHGGNSQVLNAGLEAVALTLNNFKP